MNKANKQAGNVVEWLIVGVVLIGAVALIAWRYMETDKDQTNADQAGNSSQVITKSNVGHISGSVYSLKNWAIYADVPAELRSDTNDISAVYYETESSETDAYYFVSKKLKTAKSNCEKTEALESNGAFMVVRRSQKQPPSQPNVVSKQVGDHYYWVELTQSDDCYEKDLMTKYFTNSYVQSVRESIRNKVEL